MRQVSTSAGDPVVCWSASGVLQPLLAPGSLSLTEDLQVDMGAQSSTVVIKELFILKAISKL